MGYFCKLRKNTPNTPERLKLARTGSDFLVAAEFIVCAGIPGAFQASLAEQTGKCHHRIPDFQRPFLCRCGLTLKAL